LEARLREKADFSKVKITEQDLAQELRSFREDYAGARGEISAILKPYAEKGVMVRTAGVISASGEIKEILKSSNLDGGDGALAKAWIDYLGKINQ
jgi:hypothetical protein